MNLLQRMCGRLGFSIKTKVIQEKTFFFGNCPRGCIKLMAAVILLPCFLETSFAEPGKVIAKDYDSLAVSWERFNKDVTDSFNSGWVFEFGNFSGKSGKKLSGSIGEVFQPEQINAAKNSDQGRNNGEGPSRDISDKISEIIQAFLLGLMVSAPPIVMALYSTNTPNEKLTRPKGSGAAQG